MNATTQTTMTLSSGDTIRVAHDQCECCAECGLTAEESGSAGHYAYEVDADHKIGEQRTICTECLDAGCVTGPGFVVAGDADEAAEIVAAHRAANRAARAR